MFRSYENIGILACEASSHLGILMACHSVACLIASISMGIARLASSLVVSELTEGREF